MFIGGIDFYGRIDECVGVRGRAHIHSRFAHAFWVPILPAGGATLHLVDADGIPGPPIELGLSPRSVAAAYLRVGLPALIALRIAVSPGEHGIPLTTTVLSVLIAVGVVGWLVSMTWLGRLTATERAQRRVFERFSGYPADVALMGDRRKQIGERALASVVERAALLATMYRTRLDPLTQWSAIALDPATRDVELLGAALTLARIEASYQPLWKRRPNRELFAAIWKRIATLQDSSTS
jgi:hypothetical protein